MEKFDINNIMERFGLTDSEVAKVIWPNTRFPRSSLARIRKGEACLDEKQILLLATYLGVTTSDLLSTATGWKSKIENSAMVFVKRYKTSVYRVLLNYRGSFLTIMRNGILAKQMVLDTSAFTLDGFLNFIDLQINNIENGSNQD